MGKGLSWHRCSVRLVALRSEELVQCVFCAFSVLFFSSVWRTENNPTMYRTLVRSVVTESLARPVTPIAALDSTRAHEGPRARA